MTDEAQQEMVSFDGCPDTNFVGRSESASSLARSSTHQDSWCSMHSAHQHVMPAHVQVGETVDVVLLEPMSHLSSDSLPRRNNGQKGRRLHSQKKQSSCSWKTSRKFWLIVTPFILIVCGLLVYAIYYAATLKRVKEEAKHPGGSQHLSHKTRETIHRDCLLPVEIGPCRATMPMYAFSANEWRCVKFLYGGCDGNVNRFTTIKHCEKMCY